MNRSLIMEAPFWFILSIALLASLVFLSKIFTDRRSKPPKLPPGPKPRPIIGNLNLIGSLPHQSLHKLSQRYGPLMYLKFGSYPVVIASSPGMAKEFLKIHDQIFASRPQTAAGKYINYNYSDIGFAPYGPHWRQRKHVVLVEQLSRLTLSIISRMVLGNKYFGVSDDDRIVSNSIVRLQEVQEMINDFFYLNGVFNIGDWIPWLDFLDLQGYKKRMKTLRKKLDRFHDHVFDEHKQKKKELGKDFVAQDMVDLLLQLADDPDLDVKLTHDALRGLTLDLIGGGTDTSAITVEWSISELIIQPQLMRQATEELDKVVGRERWVEEEDITQLPYIEAIMKETMRKHPVCVLLPPHLAMKDCHVAG
ncbi:hypothetical protein V6N11_066439 [Hibiscus sabdariffa]|uniref:Uncharacterized protein n=1 Tax=Hibiscus sabdariffa TaxID=183260 RepID=A0ABR2NFW2_9ROSI